MKITSVRALGIKYIRRDCKEKPCSVKVFWAKNSNTYREIMWRPYVRPAARIKDSSRAALPIHPAAHFLLIFVNLYLP